MAGRLSGAEQAARELMRLSEQRQLDQALGWALYVLGFVYYQRNELAKARDKFAQLVEWRYRVTVGAASQGYVGLALTYQALGETDKAAEICQAAFAWASETEDAGMLLETHALASRLALLQGQTPDANRWSEPPGDAVPVMLWLSVPHLTLAKVLLAQGTPESLQEAGEQLTRLRRLAEGNHNAWRLMEITALQALLEAAAGEQRAALDLLEPVLAWAEPRGYIRLFADLGPRMAVLLNQLRSQGIAPDYVGQILAAFPDQTPALVEPLTPREVEVLALLAQGLSNKEIASELVLATSSVKQYTHRIYQKLGVKNRRKAVRAAIDLGMVSTT
jgi:LuxR family maltose regulon positive regulatory protein